MDLSPKLGATVPSVLSVPDDSFSIWQPVEKGSTSSTYLVMRNVSIIAMQVYFLFNCARISIYDGYGYEFIMVYVFFLSVYSFNLTGSLQVRQQISLVKVFHFCIHRASYILMQ